MRILLARNSGFCFGVRRAVEMAENLADPARAVYTYGQIIHNACVVKSLRVRNIVPADLLEDLAAGDTLIIRAHGAPPSVYEAAERLGLRLVDATCPFVKRIHTIARACAAAGRRVLIAGKSEHPEVVGIRGHAGADVIVLSGAADAADLPPIQRATLVAQTTLSQKAFAELQAALADRVEDLEVHNTICDTTRARQTEAVEIAKRSTHVLVLGSAESANTMQLLKLCQAWCRSVQMVESADKLFLDNLQSNDIIGVVAGASAPDGMIREVLQLMSELEKTTIETIGAEDCTEGIAVAEPVVEGAVETVGEMAEEAAEAARDEAETAADLAGEELGEVENAAVTPEAAVDSTDAAPAEAGEGDAEASAEAPDTLALEIAEVIAVEEVAAEIAEVIAVEEAVEAAAEIAEAVAVEEAVEAAVEIAEAIAVEETAEAETEAAGEAVQEPETPETKTAEPSEFEKAFEKTMKRIRNGQVLEGTVISVVDGEVFVNISYKSDGIIPKQEFSSDPEAKPDELYKEGDKILVEVIKVNDGDGNVMLSRKNVESRQIWEDLMALEDLESRVFEATCKEVVKGGIIADLGGIRAFVPASQVSVKYIKDLSEFMGKPMKLKVLEVDKHRKRIVASQKQVLLDETAAEKRKKWEALTVGSKMSGVVRRITDFGAFVDIGGIDGLVHVTDAGWGRVKHPGDVLSIGQEIEVLVLNVDAEKSRISLGYKQLQPKPWTRAGEKYPVGSVVEGKVVRIVPFGAFVALESTIDGLIHISQVGLRRIAKVEDELKVGDVVRCKVLEVNQEAKRISLSRREALLEENPELTAQIEAERAGRERQAAERQEQRQQQQQQRVAREPRAQGRGEPGERRERPERRRGEDGDYELPPVQESTTSLASLFKGLRVAEDDEES